MSLKQIYCCSSNFISVFYQLLLKRESSPGWGQIGNCPQPTRTTILQEVNAFAHFQNIYFGHHYTKD